MDHAGLFRGRDPGWEVEAWIFFLVVGRWVGGVFFFLLLLVVFVAEDVVEHGGPDGEGVGQRVGESLEKRVGGWVGWRGKRGRRDRAAVRMKGRKTAHPPTHLPTLPLLVLSTTMAPPALAAARARWRLRRVEEKAHWPECPSVLCLYT